MTFDAFIVEVVRQRPQDDDWKRHLCYALMGLAGESAALAQLCQAWQSGQTAPARSLMLRGLVPIEVSRALTYYQLDQRPGSVVVEHLPRDLAQASRDMVMCAGQLVVLVRNWIFHRTWLDRRLGDACRDFERARAECYALLGVDEREVWQMHVSTEAAFVPGVLAGPLPQMTVVEA